MNPGNRRRLSIIIPLAFFSQWSGNGLVSFYLTRVLDTIGITDPTTQLLINGILQIWNLAIACTAAILVDKLGRRFLFLTSCCGMLVFFILQTVCSALFVERGSEGAAHAVIAFIFLFYAAYESVILNKQHIVWLTLSSSASRLRLSLSHIPSRSCRTRFAQKAL